MNKILGTIIVLVILIGGFFYLRANKAKAPETSSLEPRNQNVPEKAIATLETNKGNIEVTLDGKAAPKTVANFIKLANEGYYNGVKFHRIIKSFMIQSGDPNSKDSDPSNDGFGGPGYTVPAEIGLKANQGAIGMASSAAKGPSSGSQFFIVTEESEDNHLSLDGNYTFFGYVTGGMEVVSKIAATKTINNPYSGEQLSFPTEDIVINKITIK